MNKKARLNKTTEIQDVRNNGKAYSCPYFVLIVLKLDDDTEPSQFCAIATKSVGGAVNRNRAKRILRNLISAREDAIGSGKRVVVIARKSINSIDLQTAMPIFDVLLQKAKLIFN